MPTVLPDRLAASSGADVVHYPWATAGTVAAELDAVVAALNSHFDVDMPNILSPHVHPKINADVTDGLLDPAFCTSAR